MNQKTLNKAKLALRSGHTGFWISNCREQDGAHPRITIYSYKNASSYIMVVLSLILLLLHNGHQSRGKLPDTIIDEMTLSGINFVLSSFNFKIL